VTYEKRPWRDVLDGHDIRGLTPTEQLVLLEGRYTAKVHAAYPNPLPNSRQVELYIAIQDARAELGT
jgi:hypothetical protein